ncbi:ABC transporter permease [Streptococcus iniae]
MIAFVLYIIFLQHNLVLSWEKSLSNPEKTLDLWVMGGVLAVTGITTSWSALSRIVEDKEKSVWDDLLLTDVSPLKLHLGYFLSASIISLIMQVVVFLVMQTYFAWQDQLSISPELFPQLLLIAFLSSLQASLFATLVLQFVKTMAIESRLGTIIGTTSGFLVGVYIPVGVLPDLGKLVVKGTPGAYIASLYRQVLLKDSIKLLEWSKTDFREFMGIGMKLDKLTSLHDDYRIVMITIFGMLLLLATLIVIHKTKKS